MERVLRYLFPKTAVLRYSIALLVVAGLLLFVWPQLLGNLFATSFGNKAFMTHYSCYLGIPELIRLHLSSDILIGTSYVAISLTLAYLVYRARRDIPFHWVFLAFGLFIIACGGTHFMEVLTTFKATYWLSGYVKLVTAVASVATAVVLPPLIPKTLALIRAAKLSEERRQKLEETNRELEALYQKVRDVDEHKTQFFANVSHELRTPLALILGPTEKLLVSGRLDPEQREAVETIDRNARGLLKQVGDLLDVAKLDAGRMGVNYAEIDLARLLRLTVANFSSLALEREIDLTVETPPSLTAQADPEKIQRVFLNLIANAFKFTPGRGDVRCTLYRADERAVLEVLDTGPGVPAELREAIFERFRQGEGGDTRRFGGTGLGLAITKEFVELHGGQISVRDAPGGGAIFVVALPLAAPPAVVAQCLPIEPSGNGELAQAALDELRAVHEATTTGAGTRGRGDAELEGKEESRNGEEVEADASAPVVLVIEDSAEMNRFVAEVLSDACRVASAFSGDEGLEKALALRPDLIISDVMMPGMSGDQLLRELRSRDELQDVPVVMLTAKTDEELRVQLLRMGAQDYLIKPFSVEELRARVHNLLKIKRAREVLRRELESQSHDLEELANEVAAQKHAQEVVHEELRRGEERYRYLADSMPQIVWTANAGGHVDYYNRRWFEYTGLTMEQTEGWGWQPVLHPDDVERCLRRWSKAVETGEAYEIEYRFRRASDGAYRWHLGRAVPMRDEGGQVVKWFGTCTDIDDHKRAEGALRFIVEASGILAASLDYETTLANVARLSVPRLADWCVVHTVEEDGKLHQLAAAHKDEAKLELLKEINRLYPSGLDSAHGYQLVVRTGEPELISEITDAHLQDVARDEEHLRMLRELSLKSTLCVPLRARGRTLGAITFATAESGRLYNTHDVALVENLAHRAATAVDNARLYQEAQRANRAKDEFLATLSHELRTPLTPIIGWVHMIRVGMLSGEELDHGLDAVEKNSQSLARLINDLLDMSAILSGKMRLEKAPISLQAALEEAVETLRSTAERRQISLAVKACDDEVIINGDRTRLAQSFWNILANAVKFSQEQGSVRVTCEADEQEARVTFEDEGHGISPEFLPHVFDRFRQEDSSKTRSHGGLGIGLALVKSFIEAHGGRVRVESAGRGRGSRFTVQLPRLGAQTRTAQPVATESDVTAAPRPVQLLLVEDSPDTLEMLRRALEKRGFSVTPCDSAEEALLAAAAGSFDVIISDIGMPETDGYELMRRLRRLPQTSRVPAIAVSGYASSKEIGAALAAGFDSHIAKPVDPDELAAEIRRRMKDSRQ